MLSRSKLKKVKMKVYSTVETTKGLFLKLQAVKFFFSPNFSLQELFYYHKAIQLTNLLAFGLFCSFVTILSRTNSHNCSYGCNILLKSIHKWTKVAILYYEWTVTKYKALVYFSGWTLKIHQFFSFFKIYFFRKKVHQVFSKNQVYFVGPKMDHYI